MVVLFFFTFACQPGEEVVEEPAVDIEADVEVLKNMLDEWMALYDAGDFEKLVSFFYAEDVVDMTDNEPILEGRDAMLAAFKEEIGKFDTHGDISVVEDVRVSGDLAMVRGNDSGTYTLKGGGEPTKYDSKWVAIFERQPDGTWKCICEIGNSNLPEKSEEE